MAEPSAKLPGLLQTQPELRRRPRSTWPAATRYRRSRPVGFMSLTRRRRIHHLHRETDGVRGRVFGQSLKRSRIGRGSYGRSHGVEYVIVGQVPASEFGSNLDEVPHQRMGGSPSATQAFRRNRHPSSCCVPLGYLLQAPRSRSQGGSLARCAVPSRSYQAAGPLPRSSAGSRRSAVSAPFRLPPRLTRLASSYVAANSAVRTGTGNTLLARGALSLPRASVSHRRPSGPSGSPIGISTKMRSESSALGTNSLIVLAMPQSGSPERARAK